MPCYHPLPAWYARKRSENGKRAVVFRLSQGDERRPVEVPCGRCIGCQLERSRQWAVRCMHEAKGHDRNVFVTLTYDQAQVPRGGSLQPGHFVDFMKRLRWHNGEGIRFFHCGEYGEELGRPHHHAILFNYAPPDLRRYKEAPAGQLYTSRSLEELWGHGLCVVSEATFETAAYIARYALKRVVGPAAAGHYGGRHPEYLTMSRRPGIGRAFVDKYRGEIYRDDSIIVKGHPCKPPRYYDMVQEKTAPSVLRRVKNARQRAKENDDNSTGSRLVVREEVKLAASSYLRRGLEDENP